MSDFTRVLNSLAAGDPAAAEELLPLLYEELRKLAADKLAHERPGQTLQATALVHEAYLRIAGDKATAWESRAQFFAAAAEAMRRILVEAARRKKRLKRGGDQARVEFDAVELAAPDSMEPELHEDLLALDDALAKLDREDRQAAEIVRLRYFAGLTVPEAAEILQISPRSADRLWAFARAWLKREIGGKVASE